jgi:hypothetical protein
VLTRDPQRARHLEGNHVEIVTGDVEDAATVVQAVAGARIVISAIHGFAGVGALNPKTVDLQGNRALIQAARAQGVRFVLVSIHGAAPDHPIELFRMKYLAEQEVQASGLSWIIIHPLRHGAELPPLGCSGWGHGQGQARAHDIDHRMEPMRLGATHALVSIHAGARATLHGRAQRAPVDQGGAGLWTSSRSGAHQQPQVMHDGFKAASCEESGGFAGRVCCYTACHGGKLVGSHLSHLPHLQGTSVRKLERTALKTSCRSWRRCAAVWGNRLS